MLIGHRVGQYNTLQLYTGSAIKVDSRKKSNLLNSAFNVAGGPLTVTAARLTALTKICPVPGIYLEGVMCQTLFERYLGQYYELHMPIRTSWLGPLVRPITRGLRSTMLCEISESRRWSSWKDIVVGWDNGCSVHRIPSFISSSLMFKGFLTSM